MSADVFPELPSEQAWLDHGRACRVRMIERLTPMLTSSLAADEHTDAFVQFTARRQIDDLAGEDAADFFGRIDHEGGERWYVGRRHIEGGGGEPVVIDWRAAVAAAFYRATSEDPCELLLRRRFMLERAGGALVAYDDDRLDDPESSVAGGIPDPVLAAMGAARTGAMRDIVATIQAEQDHVIRAPSEGCLIVQGGPGTGKTAVGLHRAAFLLFDQRERLSREGVLVVGPNRVFLDYIAHVLPSLGERSVQQRTLADLCAASSGVPVPDGRVVEPVELRRLKGDERWAEVLRRAALVRIAPPPEDVRVPMGARYATVKAEEWATWIDAALAGTVPLNRRREGFRGLVLRMVEERHGPAGRSSPGFRKAMDRAWPVQKPVDLVVRLLTNAAAFAAAAEGILDTQEQRLVIASKGKGPYLPRPSDLPLFDEAVAMLDGVPAVYGHLIVDEAQDHTPLALRALARRCPRGSFTVLGDLAQATGASPPPSWTWVADALGAGDAHEVAHLTVGYRVPAPILELANRILPLTGAPVPPSTAARMEGEAPQLREDGDVAAAVLDCRRDHPLTGVVAPVEHLDAVAAALAVHDLVAVARVDRLAADEVPVLGYEEVKGLELDAVVVAFPELVLDGTGRGARLVYVALTRAVQRLVVVCDGPPVGWLWGAVRRRTTQHELGD